MKRPLSLEEYTNELGVSLHTALRKAVDSEAASRAWSAINEMDTEEWGQVLDYAMSHLKHFEVTE